MVLWGQYQLVLCFLQTIRTKQIFFLVCDASVFFVEMYIPTKKTYNWSCSLFKSFYINPQMSPIPEIKFSDLNFVFLVYFNHVIWFHKEPIFRAFYFLWIFYHTLIVNNLKFFIFINFTATIIWPHCRIQFNKSILVVM